MKGKIMKRPKIKTALIAVFITITLMILLFSFYAVTRIRAVNANVADIATTWMPALEAAKDIEVKLGDIRTSYRSHILREDKDGKAAAAEAIKKAHERLLADADLYAKLADTPEQREIIQAVRDSIGDYLKTGQGVISLSDAGNAKDANRILREVMVKSADAARAATDKLVSFTKAGSQAAYELSEADYATTLTVTIGAIGVLLAIVGSSIVFVLSQIAKPITLITSSMKTLAGGNNDASIPYNGRDDEVGDMASAVEVFRQNALENIRLGTEAEAGRASSEAERERNHRLQQKRAEEMAEATGGLATGLKHLASGDLTFQLNQTFAPEFESLRSDFNAAISQLAETLGAVAVATGQIDGGTIEISQSAQDLAKRTEQQAASLEETAAALDEITTNVANSSKRAEEARSIAAQANASAAQSGAVVANAVNAMQRIEQSSNQIANIIGVIDEIAFQTNLLALNAGVEAARAGEAGKGFAVVAQEVRELAQRSAQAAKEIKGLIQNSSVEVAGGVKLVSDTGEALKAIESYIITINHHMDAIATSAREQSVGLAEVNTAVNQMDQVTQQNAAMVEESNAASASLATEAIKLRDLVGQFQLAGERQSAGKLRHTPTSASSQHKPAQSPARNLVNKITRAIGGAAPAVSTWEEF